MKKMKLIVFLSFAILFFENCNVGKMTFSDAASWIPEDFNPKNGILLIETYPATEKFNKDMQDFLAKNYPGRYEIVDKDAIYKKKGKYADTKLYHFAFHWGAKSRFDKYNTPSINYSNPNGSFYDRSLNKEYPTTRKINNYGRSSYLPFLNSIVQHFK